MIQLSVGLPMLRARSIGWVGLESLCRQKKVPVDWELIIFEEKVLSPMGKDAIMKYSERLAKAGCKGIKYFPLTKRIPLADKWRKIAQEMAPTSTVFVPQSADNFSMPSRLRVAWEQIAIEGHDWIGYRKMPIYFIRSGQVFVADHTRGKQRNHPSGMFFSMRADIARQLPESNKRRGVDGWFARSARAIKPDLDKHFLMIDWAKGFVTHGINNISKNRLRKFQNAARHDHLARGWPAAVMVRMKRLRRWASL